MTREEFLAKEMVNEAILIEIHEAPEVSIVPSPARALHVPLSEITEPEVLARLPKDKMLVTLCASGGRCGPANAFLSTQGFTTDMIDGGLMGWGS